MRFLTRSACVVVALSFVCSACEEPRRAEQVAAPNTDPQKAQPVNPAPVEGQEAPASAAEVKEDKPPSEADPTAEVKEDDRPTGTVAEQKYTADYVYVRIQKADKTDIWVATAVFRGTIGDTVYLPDPKELVMKNFVSKILDRTFEEIYFVREVERPGGAREPSSRPSSAAASAPAAEVDVEALEKKAEEEGLPGKVLKAQSVGEYTYLHLNTGFKEAWVAATKVEAKPGDMVRVKGGVLMKNFHSKSLDRTFEEIYFANEVSVEKKQP